MSFGWPLAVLVLMASGSSACSVGRVSIGDDDAPSCAPEQCGEAPAGAIMCLNGTTGSFACELDGEDSCSWVALCPVLRCSAENCGPPPAESPMCENRGLAWACESVAAGCSWMTVCSEHERECSPMDCGLPPMDATECATGGMQGSSCLRDSDGSCSWTPVACRVSG